MNPTNCFKGEKNLHFGMTVSHGMSANAVSTKQGAYYRTRLCKFADQCPYGNRCFYAHSEDQIRRRSTTEGHLTCAKIGTVNRSPHGITLATFHRRRIFRRSPLSIAYDEACIKGDGFAIPTGTTELGGSISKCSFSDEDLSEQDSESPKQSESHFDAIAPECVGSETQSSTSNFVLEANPHHLTMLKAWYCYERARALLYSYKPDTLYHILKEAEPLFYSD